MARPRRTFLERYRTDSFRARHHWSLLADAPDLPVPELALLQAQARRGGEDRQRVIAREVAERLRQLIDAQREQLNRDGDDVDEIHGVTQGLAAEVQSDDPPDVDEPDLVARARLELTAGERFRAVLIRRSVEQLIAIEGATEQEGPTVAGSRGATPPAPADCIRGGASS